MVTAKKATIKSPPVRPAAVKPAPPAPKPIAVPMVATSAIPTKWPDTRAATKAAKPGLAGKGAGLKLVRDRFTMPEADFEALGELKRKCAALGQPVKKSILLRAGVQALKAMPDAALLVAVKAIPVVVKT